MTNCLLIAVGSVLLISIGFVAGMLIERKKNSKKSQKISLLD